MLGSSAISSGGQAEGGVTIHDEDEVKDEVKGDLDEEELEEEEPASRRPWFCQSCGSLNFAGRQTCHFRECKSNRS